MRLARLFSRSMVVQRDQEVPVWGWDTPGQPVTVRLAGREARTAAGADGAWRAALPPLAAGGPHTLEVTGSATVAVEDVLVGEVWLASGQSNMGFELEQTHGAYAEAETARYPQLRMFCVPDTLSRTPLDDCGGEWMVCAPDTVLRFSAVAYYFALEIQRRLGVPVGIVENAWGGTVAQAWMSPEGLAAHPNHAVYLAERDRYLAVPAAQREADFAAARRAFLASLPQDAGNRGAEQGWHRTGFDDAGWRTMDLPMIWFNAGFETNGVFWFRRVVEVPAAWAGTDLTLTLGTVDKADDTYFNGERVGGLNWVDNIDSWRAPRVYTIPDALVKAGPNVIALRVLSNYSGGGTGGPASALRLFPAAGAAAPLPLNGPWKFEIEQDFGRVTGIPEPQPAIHPNIPTFLYNSKLAPLVGYGIRGFLWYQGESNDNDTPRYLTLFPDLIRDWRRLWGRGDLPFLYVQLANYERAQPKRYFDDSRWAEIREAQAAARALPNTAMAVALDIGDPKDIHPKNKRDVGLRLALAALACTYGLPVAYQGPQYRSVAREGVFLRVAFEHAAGLNGSGGRVEGFAVAGDDHAFHPADARIEGTSVLVSSAAVPRPVSVRYGWADSPVCTLYSGAGLPAEPFRSDDWPVGM